MATELATTAGIDIEQALLGAIFLNNEAYQYVSTFLEPRHFLDPLHARIFDAAASLIRNGQRADPFTLKRYFEDDEPIRTQWGSVAVVQYIGRLLANAATAVNATFYARTIVEYAARREVQMLMAGIDFARGDLGTLSAGIERAAEVIRAASGAKAITPRRFGFPDPKSIAPRPVIMGGHYIRRYVSATIAPGGVGKSALVSVEALALVSGRRLLGSAPRAPKKVWYLGEDDQEELERRFAAVMRYYGICADDCGDRLFVQSFRESKIIVAEQQNGGTVINVRDIDAVVSSIKSFSIDVIIIDPLVKTHRVPENDNSAMETTYGAWVEIAERGNCAVELVVHSRKASGGQAKTVEDARGASSQLGAVRHARLIVRMTKEEAEPLGIEPEQAGLHIRIGDTKANMAPPPSDIHWLKLASVCLENGLDDDTADTTKADQVQVVTEFRAPATFDGVAWHDIDTLMRALKAQPRRQSEQAADWAGHLVGEMLGIDTSTKGGRSRVKAMLRAWRESGALKVERRLDETHHERPFLTLGTWAFGRNERVVATDNTDTTDTYRHHVTDTVANATKTSPTPPPL
nr:hypothetical protein [uncultured archaeon]